MTEHSEPEHHDEVYDPAQDPDADPEMLTSRELADQPDQAEGEEYDAPPDEQ